MGITSIPSPQASSVFARISSFYKSLNAAERTVADFVLSNPEVTRGLSIMRLADLSGVSQTTVIRFCKSIGLDGYREFRLGLAGDLGRQRSAVPEEHSDVTEEDSLATLLRKVLAIDMQAIGNVANTLSVDDLSKSVDALANAGNVAVFGAGASLSVVLDASYRLLRSGIQCHPNVDSHMQVISARLLKPGDVGIAITYSGETTDTLDCLEMCREAGATTICVTNHPRSTAARISDVCLTASSTKTRWINDAVAARLAQLAIIDALCVAVSFRKGSDTVPMLEQIERAAARKRRKG